MTALHRAFSVVRLLFRRGTADQELNDELQAYVDLSAAEKIRDGLPPADARRLAILELGGVEPVKEHVRTERHGAWLDEMSRDVRYACRMFARRPGLTATIVVTLALAIGANTAIFTLVDALMLRWLPVRDPQELILLKFQTADAKSPSESFSYPIVRALDDQRDLFAGVAGFSGYAFDVGAAGSVHRVSGALVTGAYYETLGLNPAAGRLIRRDDDAAGRALVAVVSDGFWQREFARRSDIVGRSLILNGIPVAVIGVSPPGFVGANVGSIADITIPIAALPHVSPQAAALLGAGNFWLRVLARPRLGASDAEAEARLNVLWPRIADALIAPHWPTSRRKAMADAVFRFSPGATGWTHLRETYATPLFVLTAIVVLVLLIACANVASLLLARASARQREIAVRLALGAGRGRIIRQLLIESVLLSAIGAAGGVALAAFAGRFLVDLISTGPFRVAFDLTPNWHVVAFTSGVAVATAVTFGIAPAVHATAAGPTIGLKDDARMSGSRSRLLPALVSTQVALSLVLVVGASLFIRTLQNLERFDPGFTAPGVLLADFEGRRTALPEDLLEAIQRVPGVISASVSTHTPLSGSIWSEPAVPAGQPIPERDNAYFVAAAPQFFTTLQIPLLAGREFSAHDSPESPAVAVINQRFAQRFFPNQNPVGRHLAASVRGRTRDLEIVGVVQNTNAAGLRAAAPPTVYVAYAQLAGDFPTTLEIRAAGPIGPVAAAVQQTLRARLPTAMIDVRPLSQQVDATLVQERLLATLAGAFGFLAIGLTCIGLYGLLAYTVVRRTKEIGIRMAMGAQRTQVVAMVLSDAARLVVLGIAAGLPAAFAGTRGVQSMLFGLKPTDPAAIAGAIALLGAAALAAAYLPARRASLVDPLSALRHE